VKRRKMGTTGGNQKSELRGPGGALVMRNLCTGKIGACICSKPRKASVTMHQNDYPRGILLVLWVIQIPEEDLLS
jgi:hypothetical protein